MTDRRHTANSVADEVAALTHRVEAMEAAALASAKAAKETHDRVAQLYDALMVPGPGQEFGLLHRQARQTDAIEAGEIVAGWAVKVAALLAALGVIGASMRVGIWPDGNP